MYDFTKSKDRSNTGSIKHDFAPEPVRGSGFIPMTVADTEFPAPPAVNEAVKCAAEHGCYGYTYADKPYMEAIAGWQKRRHEWEIDPEWYVVTNGVVQALGIAVRAFTDTGDSVIVQSPVYFPFYGAIEDNGRVIVDNPLVNVNGRYVMDFADLESKCARPEVKLMLLCSPHNPIGRVWSADELKKVAEICRRHGVVVVSDEIHNDLVLFGNRHTVFASIDPDNCIVCTAVSKTFNLAGLSCSNIFAPDPVLREKFKKAAHTSGCGCVPYVARWATIAAYNECEDWLVGLIDTVEGNYLLLKRFISERLPRLSVTELEGTYLAWIDMRALGMDHEALTKLLVEKALISDNDGAMFGKNGEGFRRWNIAIPRKTLEGALERLEKTLNSI
ncbi:MAG: pyridoxal phosphate-dependent aminotransferase [Clostridia bacterium]|nr:pyridoxal phosphate-dependent aminotransferase [Clostridia bacterium]